MLCQGFLRLGHKPIPFSSKLSRTTISTVDALIVLPGSDQHATEIERAISLMRSNSQVLAFLRHRWSGCAGPRSAFRSAFSSKTRTIGKALSNMKLAGFDRVSTWLPLPKYALSEEFVSLSHSEEVAASLACNELWSRVRGRFHDGFGVYGCSQEAGLHLLERRLGNELQRFLHGCRLRITRFDLRERGALVLFLLDRLNGKAYVCRVARQGAGFLFRHKKMQVQIRAELRQSPVVSKIPEDIAHLRLNEYDFYIEARARGSISWRLPAAVRGKLDDQLIRFLYEIASATHVRRMILESDIEAEAEVWRDQVGAKLNGRLGDAIKSSIQMLWDRLRGREASFGWVHGDYGYGNVIASAKSGSISSVIDWETASPSSFIGIDLFNFLLQRARTQNGASLTEAAAQIAEGIISGGALAENASLRSYLQTFLPEKSMQMAVLAFTLCRWVRREHRYALSQAVDAQDQERALLHVVKVLERSGGSVSHGT